MSTQQNLCRHVVFSQNCCFVANVDKALIDDSTRKYAIPFFLGHPVYILYLSHAYALLPQLGTRGDVIQHGIGLGSCRSLEHNPQPSVDDQNQRTLNVHVVLRIVEEKIYMYMY